MTRKTAVIIIIIVGILAGTFVGYIIFKANKTDTANGEKSTTSTNDFSFPFGFGQNSDNQANQSGEVPVNVTIPKLRRISDTPIAGYISFEREITKGDGTKSLETVYRYVDRATGNIFETTEDSLTTSRITNTTIPKVYEAFFFSGGSGVVLRYLDQENNVETYIANIIDAATSTEKSIDGDTVLKLDGIFLPTGVDSIVKSSTDKEIFYTRAGKGYVFNTNSPQRQTAVLDFAITEWLSDWSSKQLMLITKPSALSEGFVFRLSTTGGELIKVLDSMFGLLAIPNPNADLLLYSESKNNSVNLGLYDITKGVATSLGIQTLADKCVWSKRNTDVVYCAIPETIPSGTYPDMWYAGAISFDDSLNKIDTVLNTAIKYEGVPENTFDIQNISLSEDEEYILFQNKKDLMLWSLDITTN